MQPTDNDSLIQGGPGDQAGPRGDPRDRGHAGSQQGRPQQQEKKAEQAAERDAPPRREKGVDGPGDERPLSDMERRAGTPDERATTDWSHGEGEPGGRPG